MGRGDSSALVGNPPSDGVTIRTLVVAQPKIQQQRPGLHPATVRSKWSKTVNMIVMECFLEVGLLMMKVGQLEDRGNG